MKLNHFELSRSRRNLNGSVGVLTTIWTLIVGISLVRAEPMQGEAGSASAAKANARQAIEQQVAALPDAQRAQLLDLVNQGKEEALSALPGIGGVRSKAIQAARPFANIEDLLRVPGIGTATLAKILKQGPAPVAPVANGMGS